MHKGFTIFYSAALKGVRKLLLLLVSLAALLFAAVFIYFIGSFVFSSTIQVRNEAGITLRDVFVLGQGGVQAPADILSGQSRQGDFDLGGVSDMEVRFTTPDGKEVSEWFFVGGVGWAREIEVVIKPDLSITTTEK